MKRMLAFLCVIAIACGLLVVPTTAYAVDLFGNACGAGGADSAVCQEKANGGTNPLTGSNGLLLTIANVIALVAGAVAVFVVILAGWRYITSGGDPSKTQAAKTTLIYALVGLAVIAASNVIIGYVLGHL